MRSIFVFFLLLFVTDNLEAQGHVSSGECPYNCQMKGVAKKNCRDWRWEGRCYVENKTRPANNLSADRGKKGLIVTGNCPFNCQMAGLPKSVCRDWREGDRCVLEDLTRKPGKSVTPDKPWAPPAREPSPAVSINRPPATSDERELAACRDRRNYVARPRVDVYSADRTGNMLRSKVRVKGTIEGACLIEAGYFEEGRKREEISIRTTREFRRYEFEVVADSSRRPEIRVYNVHGDREIIPLDGSRVNETGDGGFNLEDLFGLFN